MSDAAAGSEVPALNHLVLTADVLERQALRYTPAGLPVLDLKLSHRSSVSEAGTVRQVSLEVPAVGIGPIAARLQDLPLGSPRRFSGFLARQRNGRGIVFHVVEIDPA